VKLLPQNTSGEFHFYENFNPVKHGKKMREEIVHVFLRKTAWEAVMRVRG
jgi:hypothetical protein